MHYNQGPASSQTSNFSMTKLITPSVSPTKREKIEEAYGIIDHEGKPLDIPLKGSMGLLALGYRGLMAWRAKRIESEKWVRPTNIF